MRTKCSACSLALSPCLFFIYANYHNFKVALMRISYKTVSLFPGLSRDWHLSVHLSPSQLSEALGKVHSALCQQQSTAGLH